MANAAAFYRRICNNAYAFFAVFLWLSTINIHAQNMTAPTWNWARSGGGAGDDYFYSTVVDGSHNLYATGSVNGTVSFGTTSLISQGSSDVVLAKYDAAGNLLWVRLYGGQQPDVSYHVNIDAIGYVYLVGRFSGTATFGNFTLTAPAAAQGGMFIAKLDGQGNVIWAKQGISSRIAQGYQTQIDATGNIYVNGEFAAAFALAGSPAITSNGAAAFLAKLDAQGNVQWIRSYEDRAITAQTTLNRSALVLTGNTVYATGTFNGSADFGGTSFSSVGGYDIFLVSYDTQGTRNWVQQGGGTRDDIALGIAADQTGNVYIGGSFNDQASFGGVTLTNSLSIGDSYLVKYTSQGQAQWGRQLMTSAVGYALTADATGNIYQASSFSGTARVGNASFVSAGAVDALVASYTNQGTVRWVQQSSGTGDEFPIGIALDPSQNTIVIAGGYTGVSTFGSTTLSNPSGTNSNQAFVATLAGGVTSVRSAKVAEPLFLYPNPVAPHGTVHIQTLPTGSKVVLEDAMGRIVYRLIIQTGALDLQLPYIKPGVYLLQVDDPQGKFYLQRLVVH